MTLPFEPLPETGFASKNGLEIPPNEDSAIPNDTDGLIAFIIERFHNVHRQELPGLLALARRVESVHAGDPEAPQDLADFLEQLAQELETHMQKEEQILFPMLLNGGHPMIGHPIAMMRAEHDDHTAALATIAGLAGGFQPPEHACRSWRALYAGLAKFSDDLTEHLRIENGVLFPRFGA
jgi:regulator of cell morphogenesis and NO signaling